MFILSKDRIKIDFSNYLFLRKMDRQSIIDQLDPTGELGLEFLTDEELQLNTQIRAPDNPYKDTLITEYNVNNYQNKVNIDYNKKLDKIKAKKDKENKQKRLDELKN